jgi:hypothetical protein
MRAPDTASLSRHLFLHFGMAREIKAARRQQTFAKLRTEQTRISVARVSGQPVTSATNFSPARLEAFLWLNNLSNNA